MNAVRRVNVQQQNGTVSDEHRYAVQITRGGKPVEDIAPKQITTSVEEKVMTWQNANHIHGWFVDNVQRGEDDGREYEVDTWKLRQLLEVCEKVLNGCHLVREPAYKQGDSIKRRQAQGATLKQIKNISVAHRLLPYRESRYGGNFTGYGEAYLKDVEATHAWAERMLLERENGVPGDVYYSAGW